MVQPSDNDNANTALTTEHQFDVSLVDDERPDELPASQYDAAFGPSRTHELRREE